MSKAGQETLFRSGIVARLTGIPVETLRVWERRYQVSGKKDPQTSQRLYTRSDIQRLALIKRLVDLGQSIGTIAHMDTPGLEAVQATLMTSGQSGIPPLSKQSVRRIGLIGTVLSSIPVREAMLSWGIEVRFHHPTMPGGQKGALAEQEAVDAVLIEVPTLLDRTVEDIEALVGQAPIGKVILFYRFAPNTLIRKLRLRGYAVVRMPFDAQDVVMLCKTILSHDDRIAHTIPEPSIKATTPPRYSTETLLQLSQMKSAVYCECPSQLADLLLNISAFENYSAQCASRSPEDAELHKRLERDAAQARMVLETSMAELIRQENLLFSQDLT